MLQNRQEGLSERNYVRESNEFLYLPYSLTPLEIDFIFVMLAQINKDDLDFKDYIFSKSDLESRLGKRIKNSHLKEAFIEIMRKPIVIEKENTDEVFNWFSYLKLDRKEKNITCRFDKSMKPFFIQLQNYARADLRSLLAMKSSYSKRIYMMIKKHAYKGVFEIDVEELQEILQVPKSLERYSQFKQKALNQAQKDCFKYGDVLFELQEEKVGRKVKKLRFNIKGNNPEMREFKKWIVDNYPLQTLFFKGEYKVCCTKEQTLYFEYADGNKKALSSEDATQMWEELLENRSSLTVTSGSLFAMNV